MTDCPTLPPFAAIVVAAGKGLRAGGEIPKQYCQWRGKPLIRHSVERLIAHGAHKVYVAIADDAQELAADALSNLECVSFVTGGETRQHSVRNALEAATESDHSYVLIHDAARPDLPEVVTYRLLKALENGSQAVIPVLPLVDSVIETNGAAMEKTANRDLLKRVQTPQAFRFDDILAAHRKWHGKPTAGDDAQVLVSAGGRVDLVDGDERLKKITFAEDLMSSTPQVRIGQGFDVHRLVEGEELWLCGLEIPHTKGLAGHSDADVALHCVVDALLGAIGEGDIGTHFPPSDPQWKGAASPLFVEHAVKLVDEAGYDICNVDLTLICEEPKVGPFRDAMRAKLADLLQVELQRVSIKATTTERLGFTGRGEGIAAQAVVSLQRD